MTHGRPAILASAIAALLFVAISAVPQDTPEKTYSDLQQAMRLMPMLEEISGVEDPALRLYLRSTILQFVYTQKVADIYPTADVELRLLFDDLATNRKLFSDIRVSLAIGPILNELRVSRPGFAVDLERTVENGSDLGRVDLYSIGDKITPTLLTAIAERNLQQIRRGETSSVFRPIIERIKKKDATLADRLVSASLEQDEKRGDAGHSYFFSLAAGDPVFPPTESVDLRNRYLKILLDFCRKNVHGKADDGGRAGYILKRHKDAFRSLSPEHHAEAVSLFEIHQAKRNSEVMKAEALYTRIDTSADPVAEALLEARKETDQKKRDNLINLAAEKAVSSKEFRRAVDAIMLRSQAWEQILDYRDTMLSQRIGRAAIEENNEDAVYYAMSKIESPGLRALLMGEWASKKVREPNMSVQVSTLTQGAFKLIETNPITRNSANQAFRSVYPAFFLGNTEGFDAVRRAVAIVNKLPAPTADERPGGKNYASYSDNVTIAAATGLTAAFNWTTSRDPDVAAFRVQDIQYRPYRLAAQIAIERGRRYTLPIKGQ